MTLAIPEEIQQEFTRRWNKAGPAPIESYRRLGMGPNEVYVWMTNHKTQQAVAQHAPADTKIFFQWMLDHPDETKQMIAGALGLT